MGVPDINNEYCMFVKNTPKSNYKSECPHYEGYYLLGGCGGVKCKLSEDVLEGHQWYTVCEKDYMNCERVKAYGY